jgi:hypothetical protein
VSIAQPDISHQNTQNHDLGVQCVRRTPYRRPRTVPLSTVLAEPEGLINIYHLKARHRTLPPVTSSQSTPYDQYNITILSPPWPFKWMFSDTSFITKSVHVAK